MKKKQLLHLLLTFAMILTLMSGCGNSNSESSSSDSNSSTSESATTTTSTEFAGGQGTEEDPWQIETAEQFDAIHDYLDGHFILQNDIDLSEYENWSPIGIFEAKSAEEEEEPNMDIAFTGSFDGNGCTISNVYD